MRKIFVILFVLMASAVYSGQPYWDRTTVIEVFDFENSPAGTLGNYTLDVTGTPVYSTSITPKLGSYTYQSPAGNNYFSFPASLTTAVASLLEWTIEGWWYVSNVGGYHSMFQFPWIQDSGGTGFGGLTAFNGNNEHFAFNSAFSTLPANLFTNEWWHFSIQYKSGEVKYFRNGILRRTITGYANNPFTSLNQVFALGHCVPYNTYKQPTDRLDKIIISNVARDGIETVPMLQTEVKFVESLDDMIYDTNCNYAQ